MQSTPKLKKSENNLPPQTGPQLPHNQSGVNTTKTMGKPACGALWGILGPILVYTRKADPVARADSPWVGCPPWSACKYLFTQPNATEHKKGDEGNRQADNHKIHYELENK